MLSRRGAERARRHDARVFAFGHLISPRGSGGTVRPSVSAVFARRDYITLRRLTRIPCLGEGLSNAREKCYGACGAGAVET